VSITAPASSVEAGKTLLLTASAKSTTGVVLPGKAFAWRSSSDAIATVAPDGMVTGRSPGQAMITAETGGKKAEFPVTVTPVPVATVVVAQDTAPLAVGATRQLTATTRDAAGGTLTGRTVTWSSSDTLRAKVSATGLVTATGPGRVTITATSEGRSGTASFTVFTPRAARVDLSPLFTTVSVGSTATVRATATDSAGRSISNPSTSWSSTASSVATVSSTGVVTGVAPGRAGIVARVDNAADTATVAVLGTGSILATAFPGGSIRTDARPGELVSVPVVLDLSRVSANGDLGSGELELAYDTTMLRFETASTSGFNGVVDYNLVSAGRLRAGFAAAAPQGSSSFTLITFVFRVAPGARTGARQDFSLVFDQARRLTSTSFQEYSVPVAIGGRVRVVAP